ncbi:ECF RNA polymerase sigma factor SigE [Planctomycetes bacterium Pla163]|uniref:ECF RNA polymerase sigma factor SigE n=1 Tax=Rohdeia mirabilis TaxID=2528008 RepID=A0A518D4A3_9BACT|nr:ECF RNA polymerase sigma factor SigE [Planctomycetes bacterium Pla163]
MTIAPPLAAWDGLHELRPDLERYLSARCGDPHDVEDAVQESFIRAARYRSGQTTPGRLRPWLMRIGANVIADARRGERQRTVALSDEAAMLIESRDPTPEEAVDEGEVECGARTFGLARARGLLDRALDGLAVHDRTVLRGFYIQALSRESLARRLGVGPGLVKVRLFRAKRRLRSALRREMEVAA